MFVSHLIVSLLVSCRLTLWWCFSDVMCVTEMISGWIIEVINDRLIKSFKSPFIFMPGLHSSHVL